MKLFSLLFFFFSTFSYALNPLSINVKVYAAWMSLSPYCTSPTRIFYSDSPNYQDFLSSPVLGVLDNGEGGSDGVYHCLIFKISEDIRFIPSTSLGNCTATQQYTTKFCSAGTSTVDPEFGSVSNCSSAAGVDDTIYLYLSTASTSTTLGVGNAFIAPTSTTLADGLRLTTPWTVSGGSVAKFVVNGTNKISSGASSCDLSAPDFSFSTVSSTSSSKK